MSKDCQKQVRKVEQADNLEDCTQPHGTSLKQDNIPCDELVVFKIVLPSHHPPGRHIQCHKNQALFQAIQESGKSPISCDKSIPEVLDGENVDYVPNLGIPAQFIKGKQVRITSQKCLDKYSNERREYEEGHLPKDSDHFFIRFGKGCVQKRQLTYQQQSYYMNTRLRVDFLQGESFQNALCKDGRFKIECLDNCELTHISTDSVVSLSYIVSGEYIHAEFYLNWTLQTAGQKSSRSSLNSPEISSVKKGKFEDDNDSTCEVTNNPTCTSSSNSSSTHEQAEGIQVNVFTDQTFTLDDVKRVLSKHLGLDFEEKEDKRIDNARRKKIDEYMIKEFSHSFQATPVSVIERYKKSTGIIFWPGGHSYGNGTCIRLGSRYVITNQHVVEMIMKAKVQGGFSWSDVKIVFGWIEGNDPAKEISCSIKPVDENISIFRDEIKGLDFAVLEVYALDKSDLPPPVGSYISDFPQSKSSLYIAGHPHCKPLLIDTHCVALNIQEMKHFPLCWKMGHYLEDGVSKVEQALDPTRPIYQTCLFGGSSGAPVFTNEGELVAMHARGFLFNAGFTIKSEFEQGVSMLAIFHHIYNFIQKQTTGDTHTMYEQVFKDLFPTYEYLLEKNVVV
ncbi:serine protease FAM111A-like [Glandiceps talaboti]